VKKERENDYYGKGTSFRGGGDVPGDRVLTTTEQQGLKPQPTSKGEKNLEKGGTGKKRTDLAQKNPHSVGEGNGGGGSFRKEKKPKKETEKKRGPPVA